MRYLDNNLSYLKNELVGLNIPGLLTFLEFKLFVLLSNSIYYNLISYYLLIKLFFFMVF